MKLQIPHVQLIGALNYIVNNKCRWDKYYRSSHQRRERDETERDGQGRERAERKRTGGQDDIDKTKNELCIKLAWIL